MERLNAEYNYGKQSVTVEESTAYCIEEGLQSPLQVAHFTAADSSATPHQYLYFTINLQIPRGCNQALFLETKGVSSIYLPVNKLSGKRNYSKFE